MAAIPDALLALRQAVSSGDLSANIKLSIASDGSTQDVDDIVAATDLTIAVPTSQTFPLSAPTRFISKDTPVDLRSILFAYQNKDVGLPEYIGEAQTKGLSYLAFVERLELIAWLEGGSDSEYIKPLEGDAKTADGAGDQAAPTAAAIADAMGKEGRSGGIYKHERRLGDRNTILRGIRPTDFSHVKKTAELFLRKEKPKPNSTNAAARPSAPAASGVLPTHPKKQQRRPRPIILLSPSATSLLRMSNVKTFLDSHQYTPPDANSGGIGTLNHLTRVLPSIDQKPLEFRLFEGTDRFSPEDWNLVVAVFTTGQAWQFKSYRWTEPSQLFAHVLGLYVGWKGDPMPGTVKSWGRGVRGIEIDKWVDQQQSRWRDKEVVEKLWAEIEDHMRRRAWNRDTGPR